MKPITYVLLLCATLLSSCDDGRIAEEDFNVEEEGRVAKVEVKLEGQKSWPSGYSISIAGFSDNSPYAEITKSIRTDENGQADVTLSGIPDNVKTLEVCVVNSVRRRVISFFTIDAPNTNDTIRINAGTLNASMFASIQKQIFDKQCSHCHSGSAWAASLNLNEGESYASMKNMPAKLVEGHNRVTPGDAANSVLYEALATEVSENWKHNHSKIMVTDPVGLQLIKDWINNGAEE